MREGVGRDDAMGHKVRAISLNQVGAGMRNLSSTSQSLGNFSMAIDSLLCHLQMEKLRILSLGYTGSGQQSLPRCHVSKK